MAYSIVVTQKAEQDLDEILAYMVNTLMNLPAAVKLMDDVERCYEKLTENPLMYAECQQPLLQKRQYCKAIIHDFLLLYRVDEQQRVVYAERYFSQMQDYAHKL